ncbi:MAG: type II secretion system protein GspD [Gammaproteobacteria bacterium HGW-Gammaproteobacteria-3]|nr:MAG: type II secretion system protein GspD [Gammaproteobacteria bacterium HGW-Gammaproteobacteria-3]
MINQAKKIQTNSCLVLLSLTLAGCELLTPKQAKLPMSDAVGIEPSEQNIIFEQLDNRRPDKKDKNSLHTEIYPGGGLPVSELGAQADKNQAGGPGAYNLNFDEADLGEVAKVIISDILAQNYVLSPKVAGSVTLQTTQPLTRAQLLPTLEMLLRMNNAALVKEGGVYHIEPAGDALYTSGLSVANKFKGKLPSGYQVSVIPVKNVGVDDISEILKPLMQEKTLLYTDTSRNLLVIGGSAAELERIKEIIAIFDVSVLRGRSFALFPLSNVDPATLIDELKNIFDKKSKEGESEFFRFIAIERMNAILAITHQARYLTDIETWITRLDRAKTASGGGVNVYRVQNVDAVTLGATLTDIFSSGGAQQHARPPSVAPGRNAATVTNRQTPPPTQTIQRAQQNNGAPGVGEAASVANVGDVRFIPDEINNALIIVSTAQEYGVIRKVIEQLDVMPLQVLIDATIVDVTLRDNLQYGIEWFIKHSNDQGIINSGGGFDLPAAAAGVATGGLGYSFVSNSGDVRAILHAEATKNNINVISSPSLMVLNNQEASIQVGNEISLRTSQNTPLSGGLDNGLIQTNALQQRKTGVKLNVKPRVNASGLVIMEITQSVEDPGPAKSDGSNPDILTREITSSVAVQSGETIVLGGLIKENNSNDKVGIPFLQDLPLIGPLFGNTTYNKDRTELVVLLTPRVVTGSQDARAVRDEFKRKLTGIYEEVPYYKEIPYKAENPAVH